MRVLITGGLGQLGVALQQALADHDLIIVDLPEVDITNQRAIGESIRDNEPEIVIHCAAYTDVDGCARDPAFAYKVNGLGTQNVALACESSGAEMLHISTNEVFAGKELTGYTEWMTLDPISAYGRSKAAAEAHVRQILRRFYIVRTAWLYAPAGRNFIHAILDRARDTGHLQVVADEIGNPTYADDLAGAIRDLLPTRQYGIYHFVNAGACSRWRFAQEILQLAGLESVDNRPILSRDYRRASTPPAYGTLLNTSGAILGITLRPWQEALAEYLAEHPTG